MEKTTGEKAMNMDYASTDVNSAKFKIENAFADYINLLDKASTRETLIDGAKKLAFEVLGHAGIRSAPEQKQDENGSEKAKCPNIKALIDLSLRIKDEKPDNETYIVLGRSGTENIATMYGDPGQLLSLLTTIKAKSPEAIALLTVFLKIINQ